MMVVWVAVVAIGLLYAALFRPYDHGNAPEGDAHLAHLDVPLPAESSLD
jgi:hypothetical protein